MPTLLCLKTRKNKSLLCLLCFIKSKKWNNNNSLLCLLCLANSWKNKSLLCLLLYWSKGQKINLYFALFKRKRINLYFAYFALFIVGKISLYFALLCPSNDRENAKTNSTDLSLLCPYFAYFVPTLPTMHFTHTRFFVLFWLVCAEIFMYPGTWIYKEKKMKKRSKLFQKLLAGL